MLDSKLASLRSRRSRNRALLLVLSDMILVAASFLFAYWFRLQSGFFLRTIPLESYHFLSLGAVCLVWVMIMSAHGLYRREVYLSVFDQMVGIFNSVNLGVLLVLFLAFVTKFDYFLERRLVLLVAWVMAITLLTGTRVFLYRGLFLTRIAKDPFRCRILIVGAGETGTQFLQLVRHTKDHVYDVVGFLDDDPAKHGQTVEDIRILGKVDDIEDIVARLNIERVFVAVQKIGQEGLIDLISRCMRSKVPVKMISDQFHMFAADGAIERIDGVPTLAVRDTPMTGFHFLMKRAFDATTAGVLLIVLAPLFLALAIMIKTVGGRGPVFFRQTRAGQGGKPFNFYKFRSMRTDMDDAVHRDYAKNFVSGEAKATSDSEADTPVYKMKRDPRVTGIGWILRKTSLDELPQLFNVVKGEMSLVGPRPPILYELQYYKEWHRRRLDAKPGLTGLWQVSGRSSVPFNEMVLLDLYYIDHWSLKLDFEIMLRTVPVILFGKGAY